MNLVKELIKSRALKGLLIVLGTGVLCINMSSYNLPAPNNEIRRADDTTGSFVLKNLLAQRTLQASLCFPKSVARFYGLNGGEPMWVNRNANPKITWEAMLMLDCVLQFGLSHDDYHPKDLPYDKLHAMLEKPASVNVEEKMRFDITLTDALLTFMNHLHYGKLNPDFPAQKIDAAEALSFNTEKNLLQATLQPDFMKAVLDAQPKNKAYKQLQYRIHLLEGVYQGDCYDIPKDTVRKMAINLERLRWATLDDSTYIQINIPSYSLVYHLPDTDYQYKTIVGKPSWPTPALNSQISHFTTLPEWRVPSKIFIQELLPKELAHRGFFENNQYAIYDAGGKYIVADSAGIARVKQHPEDYSLRQSSGCDNPMGSIVFRFRNIYSIYLHDTPEQKLFKAEDRDFSHGCVRVEDAAKLAAALLRNDGQAVLIPIMQKAIAGQVTSDFQLKRPVPITITYLTCVVQNGKVITYKDVYNLDKRLEMALYNVTDPLVLNK